MAFYFKCRRTKDAGRSRASTQQFQIASSNFLKGGDIFGKFMYLSHCCCRDKKDKKHKKRNKIPTSRVELFAATLFLLLCRRLCI